MTPSPRHDERYTRAIKALFIKNRPPRIPGPLAEHLKHCASCRALVEQLSASERLLAEACDLDNAIQPFEAALVWSQVAEQLELPPPAGKSAQAPSWLIWAAGSTFILLMALASFLWIRPEPRPDDGFQARGQTTQSQVELICIQQGEVPEARSARMPDGSWRCALDENLAFTVLPNGNARHVALFGIDEAGQILWYTPSPTQAASHLLQPSDRPMPLDRTVRLDVNHRPGDYRVWALFSNEALRFDRVQKMAQTVAEGDDLPVGIIKQSLSLHVMGVAP